ncbi:MAG: hypothetical protein MUF54_11740, partial [Polyangiaceae bacterium]|nr:hypothetical protein [Polyangiaceae bacterium]
MKHGGVVVEKTNPSSKTLRSTLDRSGIGGQGVQRALRFGVRLDAEGRSPAPPPHLVHFTRVPTRRAPAQGTALGTTSQRSGRSTVCGQRWGCGAASEGQRYRSGPDLRACLRW